MIAVLILEVVRMEALIYMRRGTLERQLATSYIRALKRLEAKASIATRNAHQRSSRVVAPVNSPALEVEERSRLHFIRFELRYSFCAEQAEQICRSADSDSSKVV